MENVSQQEQSMIPTQRRSKVAVLSTLLALCAMSMAFVLPEENGPVVVYFYGTIALALSALITGAIGIAHVRHNADVGGAVYAYFGFGFGILELLFVFWAIGNVAVA
ncbi:MAG: hypothetical protein WCV86_00360 [Patescibacteria group bacterium]|jgi:hypothetical protein